MVTCYLKSCFLKTYAFYICWTFRVWLLHTKCLINQYVFILFVFCGLCVSRCVQWVLPEQWESLLHSPYKEVSCLGWGYMSTDGHCSWCPSVFQPRWHSGLNWKLNFCRAHLLRTCSHVKYNNYRWAKMQHSTLEMIHNIKKDNNWKRIDKINKTIVTFCVRSCFCEWWVVPRLRMLWEFYSLFSGRKYLNIDFSC